MRFSLVTDYSATVSRSARGWHYCVHRGLRTDPATLEALDGARFGMAPTREQAWACALASLRGLRRLDEFRARAPR